MRTTRPDRFALTALRGDLPAAVLAGLVLLVQLFALGFGMGAAAAGPALRHSCTSLDAGRATQSDQDHSETCPCLAEGCCRAGPGDAPPEPPLPLPARTAAERAPSPLGLVLTPERRPLALFARAGRGPPGAA